MPKTSQPGGLKKLKQDNNDLDYAVTRAQQTYEHRAKRLFEAVSAAPETAVAGADA